jgi:hypothetical protein
VFTIHRVKGRSDRKSVVARLASVAGISGASFRTLESLLTAPETMGVAFLVERIEVDEWMQWATFLRLFRQARQKINPVLAPTIVVILPVDLPRSDVTNTFGELEFSWRGRVSSFDMRIFVRNLLGDDDTVLGKIREETIAELAGYDAGFAFELTKASEEEIADSVSLIRRLDLPAMPLPTWANGYVDEVDGEPFEHTLSAASRKDWKLIERRIWRAHARVIMSVIGDVRARFYKRYKHILANEMPYTAQTARRPTTWLIFLRFKRDI